MIGYNTLVMNNGEKSRMTQSEVFVCYQRIRWDISSVGRALDF